MQKRMVQIFGVLVAALAVLGLFIEDGHLFGIMNANLTLDLLRVVLAAVLLYVGFGRGSDSAQHGALVFLGVLYIGLGLLGLIDSELFGLLPAGLTGFDIAFHLATGVLALWAGLAHSTHQTAHA